jgi:DNA-binding response OmpR family regulator
VLLIEHDPWLRSLLTNVLANDEGYTVLPAASGQAGLRLAQQHPPDVILLDLALPDQSGFEVLRQLQTQPPTRRIPVLVVSSSVTLTSAALGDGAGAVPMPFSLTSLVAEINRAAARYSGGSRSTSS